jgi:hypothetical protein
MKNGIGIWREERTLRDLLLGGIYCPAIESEGMQNVFSSAISTSSLHSEKGPNKVYVWLRRAIIGSTK